MPPKTKEPLKKTDTKNSDYSGVNRSLPIVYPNIEWADRTIIINGKAISYTFGNGNPKEVAISEANLVKLRKAHLVTNYMHPEAEQSVKTVLSDPFFTFLVEKYYEYMFENDPTVDISEDDWSMEHILYIDSNTGRKEFNDESIQNISNVFTTLYSPVAPSEAEQPWRKYMTEAEFKHMQDLQKAFVIYPTYYEPDFQ